MRLSSLRLKRYPDFFGIASITSKDIAGISSHGRLHFEQIAEKYEPLTLSRSKCQNEQNIDDENYGFVRYDCYNIPQVHGHFEPDNKNLLYNTQTIKELYVDSSKPEQSNHEIEIEIKPTELSSSFCSERPSLMKVLAMFDQINSVPTTNQPPLTFVFTNQEHKSTTNDIKNDIEISNRTTSDQESTKEPKEIILDDNVIFGNQVLEYHELEPETKPEPVPPLAPQLQKIHPETEKRKPLKAIEYLKDIRRDNSDTGKIILDSMGFNDFSKLTIDWSNIRRIEARKIIKSSIVYDNYDVTIINKPYGISSHCEQEKSGGKMDVNSLMQELAEEMNTHEFFLAHRLDKTTTGLLVFARNQQMAQKLNKLFKSDLITKKYLCITRGVPDPKEAIIDIPIGQFEVAGKVRSCLCPQHWGEHKQITPKFREARRAITQYKVVDNGKDCALVEVMTKTGVKHQIRCHLGFGLSKPILGDHKYSNLCKIAPQKLPLTVLKLLRARQAKTRTIPVQLHASHIAIPDVKHNGQTLFVKAPLPHAFSMFLKMLKMTKYMKGDDRD